MTQGLNERAEVFRNLTLKGKDYPVIWVDALYEKVRFLGRIVSMAIQIVSMTIQIVYGVKENGQREILVIEPMLEESSETYRLLFTQLKECGLSGVKLIVFDAQSSLVKAIRESFPGASWQRCKVSFIHNILVHASHKDIASFASLEAYLAISRQESSFVTNRKLDCCLWKEVSESH